MRKNKVPYLIRKFFPSFLNQYTYYYDMYLKHENEVKNLGDEILQLENLVKGINSILEEKNNVLIKVDKTNKKKKGKEKENVILYEDNTKSPSIYVNIPFRGKTINVLNLFITINNGKKEIKIEDIQVSGTDIDKGYGTVALEYLISKAEKNNIKRIYGNITADNYADHGERLVKFYENFEFDVHIYEDNLGGYINKYL